MKRRSSVYSVLPRQIWKRLDLQPMREVEFTLADGTVISRELLPMRLILANVRG